MNRRLLSYFIIPLLSLGVCATHGFAGTTDSNMPLPSQQESSKPGVHTRLNHVFLIMMENHSYDEIINNESDAPFINALARHSDLASRYYAVGHPSLTNYLEVVGGSNFGTDNDLDPHWGSAKNTKGRYGLIPRHGVDIQSYTFSEAERYAVPGGASFIGKTLADQLAQAGKTWKTYQESLPVRGGYGIDRSDGKQINRGALLYAVKHNPFEYFRSTQGSKSIVGYTSDLRRNTIGGELQKDLAAGNVANFNFIAPNLCHDMHGMPLCSQQHKLIRDGDMEAQALIDAITGSATWKKGRNVIILMWDEMSYGGTGHNRVPLIVKTNYQSKPIHSSKAYNHFSLLKTMEKGFGLHYINHAKDPEIHAMSDIFSLH